MTAAASGLRSGQGRTRPCRPSFIMPLILIIVASRRLSSCITNNWIWGIISRRRGSRNACLETRFSLRRIAPPPDGAALISWIAPCCFISQEAARRRVEGNPARRRVPETEGGKDALLHRNRPGQEKALGRGHRGGRRAETSRLRVPQRRRGVRGPARQADRGRRDARRIGRVPGGHRPLRAQPHRVPRGPRLPGSSR